MNWRANLCCCSKTAKVDCTWSEAANGNAVVNACSAASQQPGLSCTFELYLCQVGNFRVEPPGLFRGRGEHPRMGKLKSRIYPRDIVINIGPLC